MSTLRTKLLALFLLAPATALAGGALETIDLTDAPPSPLPGQVVAKVIGIKWDARCVPVQYAMNTTLDPIPNPEGAPFLTVAQARVALQQSLDAWNAIPTAFIASHVTTTTTNPGTRGFDFTNELTFRTPPGFGAIASSPSTSLTADATFAAGDDIDGDGDSDVAAGLRTCRDADGDGDIEFPPGFYAAGTILDNDVQFNTDAALGFRFTVDDAALDTNPYSVDLRTVATHEFGHSIGLSHTLLNQQSAADGTGATMFPFIDTGDPASELEGRTLEEDDVAWASYFYPEGSARSGPAALQRGDRRFTSEYALIQGEVRHGAQQLPVAGAHVVATTTFTQRSLVSAFSGHVQLSYDPATDELFLLGPEHDIVDGRYTLPVPTGLYTPSIEATDGLPAASTSISFTAQVGDIYGQQDFHEERWSAVGESEREYLPGLGLPVLALAGGSTGPVDFETNAQTTLASFGSRDFAGFTNAPAGTYYAVRIPRDQVLAASATAPLLHQALYDTAVQNASQVPVFSEALLTRGEVRADGSVAVDLASPFVRVTDFVGQEDDFSVLYFRDPAGLGARVRAALAANPTQDVFLVLRLPLAAPPGGVPLIGLDGFRPNPDAPIFGNSFVSADGTAWTREARFNFRFALVLSQPPAWLSPPEAASLEVAEAR